MHDIRTRPIDQTTYRARPGESWRPERCDRIALVLQGGGALGAYQAGVYQAMHEAGVEPDWVSGVSIVSFLMLERAAGILGTAALSPVSPASPASSRRAFPIPG